MALLFVKSSILIKWLLAIALASALSASMANVAHAVELKVRIDISSQTMSVARKKETLYVWRVSTARRGYRTPIGTYKPIRLERMWYSTKYDNAPMPHSVFFYFGYAIHGTNDLKHLGTPASHGCVRLHPDNARRLYSLIKLYGKSRTTIIVQQ